MRPLLSDPCRVTREPSWPPAPFLLPAVGGGEKKAPSYPQLITRSCGDAGAGGLRFAVASADSPSSLVASLQTQAGLKSQPLPCLLFFFLKGTAKHIPTMGRPSSATARCCVPTEVARLRRTLFDFNVPVLCLHDTHVELEIRLSLPDNNVRNGASCMNHYLQPGVVLLMNMREPGEGRRGVCATCLPAGPGVLSLSFRSGTCPRCVPPP